MAATPRIEMVEVDHAPEPHLTTIPWLESGEDPWTRGVQIFDVPELGPGESPTYEHAHTSGWAAVDSRHIYIRIVIEDEYHVNTRMEGDIWDGDSIQLGIDARGDGVGGLDPGVSITGPDDASITFALTQNGPKVWAHYHGRPGGIGALPETLCSIVRDEAGQTTTYELSIPWSELQSVAGITPFMGLALQINDQDENEAQRVYWGSGAGGNIRPGLFNRLAVGPPSGEYAAALPAIREVWRAAGSGTIILAVSSAGDTKIRARLGDLEEQWTVSAADRLHRFAVRAYPGELPVEEVEFKAEVGPAKGKPLAAAVAKLGAPGQVIDRLSALIEERVANSPHPLFTRHLRSIEAVVQAEWNRTSIYFQSNPAIARNAADYASTILEGLEGEAGEWEGYATGRRSMIFSFVSSRDRTLQFYRFQLPPDWDPERAYPLIVSMHGAGNPHPLGFLAGPNFSEPLPAVDPEDSLLDTYVLSPWGRGNLGYRGIAERDVYEAIGDALRGFKTDADRHYLTGHSMGGGGTWSLAIRTPDRWAAICIVAGATWGAPPGVGLGQNLTGLPVRIWHGDSDNAVPVDQAYAMQREMQNHDLEPDMQIIPGQGHGYPSAAQRRNFEWLLSHVRQRPDSFSFMADTEKHTGRNGISMRRNVTVSATPSFSCRIDANQVHIETQGTPAVELELGEEGLGLEGEVVVHLNGTEAYRGPAKPIELEVEMP